jgi:hypothetical protein
LCRRLVKNAQTSRSIRANPLAGILESKYDVLMVFQGRICEIKLR